MSNPGQSVSNLNATTMAELNTYDMDLAKRKIFIIQPFKEIHS